MRARTAIGLLGLLALAAAFGTAALLLRRPPDPFKGAAVSDPPFAALTYGIQAFLWWDSGEAGLHLDWVRLMSYSHVKQTFAWSDIEPQPGLWDWEQADRIVAAVQARGLQLIARLGQVPQWARADVPGGESALDAPPAEGAGWQDYCYRVARRYRGRIAAYQIWNEPNLSREWGGQPPDAAAYAALLADCSRAIRRADPAAILISAGLAPTGRYDIALPDDIYFDAMYRSDFQQHIDVVGAHAPGYNAPEIGPDDVQGTGAHRSFSFRRIEDLRKIMLRYGDEARQMAIMEFGYTTDPHNPNYEWFAVDQAEHAAMLVRAYDYAIEHWRPWVGLMTLIYMPDPAWTPADEEYWWAITKPDRGVQQGDAFIALANMRKVCGEQVIAERAPDSPTALGLQPAPLCS